MSISSLTLFFDAMESEAAELIGRACEKGVRLIRESWGLDTPEDLRVCVMTSWLQSTFRSASWPWRVLLGVTVPFWGFRARRLWRAAGGWALQYGRRRVVGVKPPRLVRMADRSIGARIFIQEEDLDSKVQQITCHELTHAFTSHLRLPLWLHEGLAMVTVDRFVGKPTVKEETIAALAHPPIAASSRRYSKLGAQDADALVYLYVRGYWLTRYLEETRPGLLKSLLGRRYRNEELENRIAAAYGMEHAEFWHKICGLVTAHFGQSK